MSIYERMMNRTGGVKVDTTLDISRGVRCGEELSGTVILRGGRDAKHVTAIEFGLVAEFFCEKNKQIVKDKGVIYRHTLGTSVTVAPGEEKRVPFRFRIPLTTPVSIDSSKVWLETTVNVEMEETRNDRDAVPILPHPIVHGFFEAVKLLGLRLDEVSLLHVPHLRTEFPFVQEFEFKPRLPSALDEIEVYYTADRSERVNFFIEIDRRAKGLSGLLEEAFDWDERHIRVTLTKEDAADPERLADKLARCILPHLK
ncbi:sporulation protein [Cohnella algarum]|uniref:sporulation protein n=1 Tax=Cohnella algarum TaxID=2044859 RepID=UPI0019685089|nr:sporulation protein [Cohnella algarum]MBN2981003.1 sporulation protein [Cohnella algarum]